MYVRVVTLYEGPVLHNRNPKINKARAQSSAGVSATITSEEELERDKL